MRHLSVEVEYEGGRHKQLLEQPRHRAGVGGVPLLRLAREGPQLVEIVLLRRGVVREEFRRYDWQGGRVAHGVVEEVGGEAREAGASHLIQESDEGGVGLPGDQCGRRSWKAEERREMR